MMIGLVLNHIQITIICIKQMCFLKNSMHLETTSAHQILELFSSSAKLWISAFKAQKRCWQLSPLTTKSTV